MSQLWTTSSNTHDVSINFNSSHVLVTNLIHNGSLNIVNQSLFSSTTILFYRIGNQSLLKSYTTTQAIFSPQFTKFILIFLVSSMTFMTVLGNLLVIIAFLSEPAIRTYSNYFILNLSIADLLIGLIW